MLLYCPNPFYPAYSPAQPEPQTPLALVWIDVNLNSILSYYLFFQNGEWDACQIKNLELVQRACSFFVDFGLNHASKQTIFKKLIY